MSIEEGGNKTTQEKDGAEVGIEKETLSPEAAVDKNTIEAEEIPEIDREQIRMAAEEAVRAQEASLSKKAKDYLEMKLVVAGAAVVGVLAMQAELYSGLKNAGHTTGEALAGALGKFDPEMIKQMSGNNLALTVAVSAAFVSFVAMMTPRINDFFEKKKLEKKKMELGMA